MTTDKPNQRAEHLIEAAPERRIAAGIRLASSCGTPLP
jgi:hypothetical protein